MRILLRSIYLKGTDMQIYLKYTHVLAIANHLPHRFLSMRQFHCNVETNDGDYVTNYSTIIINRRCWAMDNRMLDFSYSELVIICGCLIIEAFQDQFKLSSRKSNFVFINAGIHFNIFILLFFSFSYLSLFSFFFFFFRCGRYVSALYFNVKHDGMKEKSNTNDNVVLLWNTRRSIKQEA